MEYQQAITDLRVAYSRESAAQRDKVEKDSWKVAERQRFLALLQQENRNRLISSLFSIHDNSTKNTVRKDGVFSLCLR